MAMQLCWQWTKKVESALVGLYYQQSYWTDQVCLWKLYIFKTHTHMKQTFHLKIIKKNINNSSNIIIIIIINIYQMTKDKRV